MGKVPVEFVHKDLQEAAEALATAARGAVPDGMLCVIVLVHNESGNFLLGGNVEEESLSTVLRTAAAHVDGGTAGLATRH